MKKLLGDRHQLFAFLSVLAMFLGTGALWWFVLVGGNPYHPGALHIYDQQGTESYQFKRGEWVIVRRQICLDRDILAEQSPALYDLTRKALVPLPRSAVVAAQGCAIRSSMFQIPNTLPPGPYEYRNVSRFQNNLVGRDEANSYPPMKIEVLP
jgi:hypothetical protein